MENLNAAAHKQTFETTGKYCTKKNELKVNTYLPEIPFLEEGQSYKWKLKNCYDISNTYFPCMLVVYSHGHSDRSRLEAVNMDWARETLELKSVFKETALDQKKIFVITLHDEDFEERNIEIYRFYAEHHVSFDSNKDEYVYDIDILQHFIAGKPIQIQVNEEPKTAGGGVIDPV